MIRYYKRNNFKLSNFLDLTITISIWSTSLYTTNQNKSALAAWLAWGYLGLSMLLTLGNLKLVNGLTINTSGKLEFDENKKEDIIFMNNHFRLRYKSMKNIGFSLPI